MDRKCFFGICTNRTKDECLTKNLFGDNIQRYDGITEGDIGFLWNVSNDTLIGVFRALGPARKQIEPTAWNGQFPVQIRVKPIGRLQTLRQATQKLENSIKLISVRRGAYKMPQLRVHEADVTRRMLDLFPHLPQQAEKVERSQNISMDIPDTVLASLLDLPIKKDDIFENARALFEDYEENENLDSLTEALDLLAEIEMASNPKVADLKDTICKYVNAKLLKVMQRYNISEFARRTNNIDEVKNLIAGSLNDEDLSKFIELMQIKTYYCG